MDRIIRLDRRHIDQLACIDFESEHQGDKQRNVTKPDMKKTILKRFKTGHEIFFGYKHNNQLLGYITLRPFFPGHRHCEVYWLAVRKKFQGQTIGTKLLCYVEEYAKEKGFRKVCLYTGKDMLLTRRFYEKNGYRLINEFPGYYGYETGNTTAVLYAKSI